MKNITKYIIVLLVISSFIACKKNNFNQLSDYPISYDTVIFYNDTFIQTLRNIYIPNAFSPNGDGLNDIFYVRGGKSIIDFRMVIYNNDGIKLFETLNINEGWDGRNKKRKLQATGTYSYIINGTLLNGEKYTFPGEVMLVL